MRPRSHRRTPVVQLLLALLLGITAGNAEAETRVGIVNLSGSEAPAPLVEEIGREVLRLRPGTEAIREDAIARQMATGEAPVDAARRLTDGAVAAHEAGDCAAAVPQAREAESLTLGSVATDEERDVLKRLYTVMIQCEAALERPEPLADAARRLRALSEERPEDLPEDLWDAHVKDAVVSPENSETTELLIDSEPANAQIFINFHNEGTTPRTLALPRGEVLIEIEKDGYKKAFRRLVLDRPDKRTVFRLIETRRDRTGLVTAAMRVLAKHEPPQRKRVTSNLAQWARADLLILLRIEEGKVRIWQFDAERGAFAQEVIESEFDPETGRVKALAKRKTPKAAVAKRSGLLAPGSPSKGSQEKDNKAILLVKKPSEEEGLPTTFVQRRRHFGPKKTKPPWWSYLIAAGVLAGIAALVVADQPTTENDLRVKATWDGF